MDETTILRISPLSIELKTIDNVIAHSIKFIQKTVWAFRNNEFLLSDFILLVFIFVFFLDSLTSQSKETNSSCIVTK